MGKKKSIWVFISEENAEKFIHKGLTFQDMHFVIAQQLQLLKSI